MSNRRPILLIDDDAVFSASLATLLETSASYSVTQARTAAEAFQVLGENALTFDAILVDVGLPDEDGVNLVGRLRANDFAIPIILITGSDDEAVLVRGLQIGADDFVRKPFRGTELLARLHSRLRAFAASRDAALSIGRYVFHPGKRVLVDTVRNSRITLADKEAKLLSHLYHGIGDIVSRIDLLHAIWGYSSTASTHTVETHIYRLRQKVELDPARPTLIVTERGGYRLVLPGMESRGSVSFPLGPRLASQGTRSIL